MADRAGSPDGPESGGSSSSFTHSTVGQGVGRPLMTTHESAASSSSGDSVNLVFKDPARPPDAQGPVDLTFSERRDAELPVTPLAANLKAQSTLTGTLSNLVGDADSGPPGSGEGAPGTYDAPASLSATVTMDEVPSVSAAVVRPQNDDPWDTEVADKLDVQKDALAFARLAGC